MSRRIKCKTRSVAGVGQSDLLSDDKYVKVHKGQETRAHYDESNLSPISKVEYSLRSGRRQASSCGRSRCAQRPMAFMSQSRERYVSDVDDDDSVPCADNDSERDESEFLAEADGESTDIDSDEMHMHTARPQIPDITDVNVPELILPETAFDLVIDTEFSLQAVGIYQVLRQFSRVLHLSLFRFEDFCSALTVNEQSCLLAETHIALLKCILQEEDSCNSTFGPTDAKDSINISLYVIDSVTWFEAVRMYLESLTSIDDDFQLVLRLFSYSHYQDLNTSQRLLLLQILTDLFLATNLVREAIMKEGAFIHEEQCRFCHRRGDLICCETCPAVFHLECLKPPLAAVPDDDWFCCVCSALQVKGVNECLSDVKKNSLLCRMEPIGYDRHQRKYWFLCRRVFIEADGRTWYYSTPAQLEELMLALDDERWEVDLVSALRANQTVILEQMAITEELTNKVKGKRSTALAAHDEFLKDQHLKIEGLQTVKSDKDSVEQRMECSEEDRKHAVNILNENEIKANREESFEVQDLKKSGQTNAVQVENGDKETSNDGKVSDCQSQDKEFRSEESEKHGTALEALVGDVSVVGSDLMILKDDNACGAASAAADPAAAAAAAADVSHSAEEGQQNVKEAESDENDEDKTTKSAQKELSSANASLPFAEGIKNPISACAVEMSSSLASDSISEIRQTRSKSKHLGVYSFEGERQSNYEQRFGPFPLIFKLGMEGKYKTYVNLYSTNPLALSKQQQNDDREKRRHLSYKFSLTPLSEFLWNGVIYGQSRQTVDAVKRTLFDLEGGIGKCFLHPNWCQNSGRWQKAVSLCSTPADFGLALMILEACMKPLLFNCVWHESLGHIGLRRTTAAEKEEQKKKEKEVKRTRYEEECVTSTWVKYSLGLHHQVWKQKGEEYRSTGKGGWFWISFTRVKQVTNLKKCSLLQISRQNCQSDKARLFNESDKSVVIAVSQESDCESIQPSTVNRKDSGETSSVSIDTSQVTEERTELDCGAVELSNVETEKHEGHLEKHGKGKFPDCVNVSEALIFRSYYKKKSAVDCVLDGLLERRTRQLELEMEQKAALELSLRKFHIDALREYSQQKGSSGCPDSDTGLYSDSHKSLVSPDDSNCVANLNFAKQEVADSEHSKDENEEKKEEEAEEEEEEEEENSDNEVTLEKEDLEDNSSVEESGCAGRCQVDDVVMSEDSNISNASSSLAANIIPPPIQSKSLRHTLLEQSCSSAKALQEVSDQKPYMPAAETDATQMEINCSHNVINSLQKYIKDGNIILTKDTAKNIKEGLKEVGKTQFQVRLVKQIVSVTGKKKRKQLKKGSIPRAQNFLTRSNKRSLFILERDELSLLARKGGQKEALGFNYACKIHDVSWPYPCPRPYFKTAWKYRTQTAKNLSAIALQLRILWANIRWDDMAAKCAAGKNTTVSETELTTVELLKRRDIGPTNLRAEYLIQKTVTPLDVPVSNKERALPSQRSGLRERRQQETAINKEPVISEFWVPEEQLELWQVKLFAERLEKKQHKQKEKTCEKKTKTATPCGKLLESNSSTSRTQNSLEKKSLAEPIVEVGSLAVEEELQQQRMLMRQRRLGLSLLRGEHADQMNSSSSSSSSTRGSLTSITPTASQSNLPRSLKLPFKRLGVLKTNNKFTVSRSAIMTSRLPVISCPVSASQSICSPAAVVSAPMLSPPPPMSSSPSAASSVVQSIRIRKGPDGQLQITGLQPGQEIIRLPDGRLRLVAKPLPTEKPSVTSQYQSSYCSAINQSKTMSSAQPGSSLEACNASHVHNISSESSSDVQLGATQNRKESVQGRRPEELELPSADKQTSVSVATAVEKLFACLSPLRLQNKQRFSEKTVCNRQPSSSDEANDGHLLKNAVGGPAVVGAIGESLHALTKCNIQLKDPLGLSDTGLVSPSHAELPTCLSPSTDKQKDHHSDRRGGDELFQHKHLNHPDGNDVGHRSATLSDQRDFLCKNQNSAWKKEADSDASLLASPKGNLTGEAIGNMHTLKMEQLSYTAHPMTGCSNEISQGCQKRKMEGVAVGTVAGQGEFPATPRKKGTDCKLMIVKESGESQSTLNKSKATSDGTVSDKQLINQAKRGSCKRKLSSTGTNQGIGVPLKKYQSEIGQLTGEKRGTLDVNRQRLGPQKRSDNGEPPVLSSEVTKKQSKKMNAGGDNSRNCTEKQHLLKVATDPKEKLLCVCQTRYDPSRFYVGCDVCLNWFHGSCVDISEEEVFAIGSFVCSACKLQQSDNEKEKEELFCICHQPYDQSLFYIGCNDCGGWFHGGCVDVSPSDVGRMDCYTCPTCNVKRGCSRIQLHDQHLPSLKKLISSLKLNSLAKPICKQTHEAESQGYSAVIRGRIDFSVVEQKIESCTYFLLEDFVTDVLAVFSNCRVYNNRKSPIFISAIKVEMEFMRKFEKLKAELFKL